MSGFAIYVYYRVDLERLDTLRALMPRMLAEVEARTGIRGRWLRRTEEPSTYMEVYEGVPDIDRFLARLAETLGGTDFEACLAPGAARRVERFMAA